MRVRDRRRFRGAIRALRAECPLILPVRVVLDRRPPPKPRGNLWRYQPGHYAGWSTTGGGEARFRVVVRTHVYELGSRTPRAMFRGELIETLMHEWAHCMAWNSDHAQLESHGPAFGLAYAECYRAIVED